AEVVPQPGGVIEILGPTELGSPEHPLVCGALVAEVVYGVTHSLVRHRRAVLLVKQYRDEPGLPVMAMNDIGTLISPEHKLERCPRKEREALRIVPVPIQAVAAEEVVCRVRLDEKTLAPVHVTEPYRAVNCPLIPRHPQVPVAGLQAPDIGVPHAGILRQD